jgi:hypothetical protein
MDTMDTKSHRIDLTQKRKAENGLWQFYPVQWDGNKPDPRLSSSTGNQPHGKEEARSFWTDERAANGYAKGWQGTA